MVVVYPERKRKSYHRINLHDAGGSDPYVMRKLREQHLETAPNSQTVHDLEMEDLLGAAHERKKKLLIQMVWKTAIIGLALATLVNNIYALLFYGGFVQFLACAVASAASVTIAYIEVTMEDTDRQSTTTLKDLNQLSIGYSRENSRLSQQLRDMKVKLFGQQEAESRLKFMLRGQHYHTRTVINLAAENHSISEELKRQARSNMVEDLFSVLYEDEKINDVTDRVIKNLIKYIHSWPSVIVNERRLDKIYQGRSSDRKLMGMVHCLLTIGIPTRERIFIFDDEDEELQKAVSSSLSQREWVSEQKYIESQFTEEPMFVPLNDEKPMPKTWGELFTGKQSGSRPRPRGRRRSKGEAGRCRSSSPSKELMAGMRSGRNRSTSPSKELAKREPRRGQGLFGAKSMPRVDRKKFFAAAKGPKKDAKR